MSTPRQYFFGEFRLDADQRALFRRDQLVPLAPKALDTLLFLVERHGQIVDKKQLMDAIWPGTFVEEVGLARNVSVLRRLLSDHQDGQSFIETIPKRGYRFTAPVHDSAADEIQSVQQTTVTPFVTRHSQRRLWTALLLGAFVVAVAIVVLWRHASLPSSAQRPVLVVLPVQNLTGNPGRDYIADGLTEELIAELGSLGSDNLGVIARTSSMAYKNSSKTIGQIGKELGAEYVLECSFRDRPGEIRFTAQLIRTADQTHLWAQDFDESLNDLVSMEDDVAVETMKQIRLKLSATSEKRALRPHPVDAVAQDLYLKGREQQNTRTRDGLDRSIESFQAAIQRDPRNAVAYAALADSLNLENFYGYSPGAGTVLNAQSAAAKAMELDDSLAEGHASMAYLSFMWLWDWHKAETEFQRALQLNPNYVPAHHWYALYLTAMGRKEEANNEIKSAQRLDPISPIVNTAAGYIHFFNREYEKSIADCLSVLNRDPNFAVAHAVLGRAYDAQGLHQQAIAELQRAVELSGGHSSAYFSYLGHAYAAAGQKAEAEEMLSQLDRMVKDGAFVGESARALIYAGSNDWEDALLALNRASGQNDANLIWLRVEPAYDSIRSNSKFQELLRKQGIS